MNATGGSKDSRSSKKEGHGNVMRKSFRLAKPDNEVFTQFMDDMLFGCDRKQAVLSPIPFGVGPLKFTIERNKSGLNKLYPTFTLYIEKPYGNKVTVLFAKKRAFNKTANFLISLTKTSGSRESNLAVGKLRALDTNDKYVLYDNGENYSKLSTFKMSQVRTEHGYFTYRYEPCNVGNIRKMVIALPAIYPELFGDNQHKFDQVREKPETLYNYAAKYPKLKFMAEMWRPV